MAGSTAASPSTTYSLTLSNDISIASNGPAGSENFAASGTIGFDITITNPCHSTTIPNLTFNPSTSPMQVTDGATGSIEFARPVNGVESSTGLPLVCGVYVFEVYQDTSDTALSSQWVTVAEKANQPGLYDFSVDTTVDSNLLTSQST